jgi:arabinofuranosyltransferase
MNLRRGTLLALLVAAAGALVAHSLVFDFVTDDAYISFVYARNLAQHGQLVFNVGEPPVEGYTNLLWTLLLAGLLKLGLLPELTSRICGTAFAIATLGVTAWISRRLRTAGAGEPDRSDGGELAGEPGRAPQWSAWDALPALLLAGVPGYACWSSGGLETQMFTFFVTLGSAWQLAELLDDAAPRKRTAVAFGLAALTRPEGILFFALAWLYRLLVRLRRRQLLPTRADVIAIACFLALVVPHFVWRRWYYGWWLPNTFYIKSSGVGGHWQQGGYYLWRVVQTFHLWVVPIVAVAGWLARPERGARLLVGYASLVVTLFAVYVASVAGDFMGLFRFVMPAIPLLALVAADGLRLTLTTVTTRQPLAAPAVVATLLGLHAWHAVAVDRQALVIEGPSDRGIDRPAWLRWYTDDRVAIGRWFARYARPDDYAAVGGAGAQVYFSGMRSLDCYGLSDAHIAHDVPANNSRPGHQKYAPTDYILSKHPTIITSSNYRISNLPYVGADSGFWMQHGYHYVTVDVPGLSSPKYSFLLRNDRSLGPLPALTAPKSEERDP